MRGLWILAMASVLGWASAQEASATSTLFLTIGSYDPLTGTLCMDLTGVGVQPGYGPMTFHDYTGRFGDGSPVDTDAEGNPAPEPDGRIYGRYVPGLPPGTYLVPNGVFPGAPGAIDLEIGPEGSCRFRQVRTR